jgi:hypothetical protein
MFTAMRYIFVLLLCTISFLSQAQNDVLVLTKKGMHVRAYTVGDAISFETVYGQWFTGNISDLRRDTVYMNGQAFSYKEIGAISREKSSKTLGVLVTTAGVGVFALGAINGGLRGDKASEWFTTTGYIVGGVLIATGIYLLATTKKYYTLGRKYKLQYLQIGRR